MIIRGRRFPLPTYRKRRTRSLAAVRKAHGAMPILILGAPESDPVLDITPTAGKGRQDPWFDWICGCHEGDAALLLDPNGPNRDTLFLEPGDPGRIVWDGERLQPGPVAKKAFGVHNALPIKDLKKEVMAAAERAGGRIGLLWRDREPGHQARLALQWKRKLRGIEVINVESDLVPLRMVKEAAEIAWHREAIKRTAKGLKVVMPQIPKMRQESDLAAALIREYCRDDYEALAFAPIVGSAVRGATLHYKFNDQPLERGKPVLIDSGARAGGYCADVTRTLPQSGRFTNKRFREVYELVLKCNSLGRKHARPGITLQELNAIAWQPILDAGFERHHGLSHHIGLDVHDPADYGVPLKAGMVISNEPGVYLPDERFGIRIEDDLLITADGSEDMTRAIPKTVKAIEKAMT